MSKDPTRSNLAAGSQKCMQTNLRSVRLPPGQIEREIRLRYDLLFDEILEERRLSGHCDRGERHTEETVVRKGLEFRGFGIDTAKALLFVCKSLHGDNVLS